MLYYDNDTKLIKIVAKDTGDFVLTLDNYTLDEGDEVVFTVNTATELPKPIIQKKIIYFDENNAVIRLTKQDTNIAPGNYYYDV